MCMVYSKGKIAVATRAGVKIWILIKGLLTILYIIVCPNKALRYLASAADHHQIRRNSFEILE